MAAAGHAGVAPRHRTTRSSEDGDGTEHRRVRLGRDGSGARPTKTPSSGRWGLRRHFRAHDQGARRSPPTDLPARRGGPQAFRARLCHFPRRSLRGRQLALHRSRAPTRPPDATGGHSPARPCHTHRPIPGESAPRGRYPQVLAGACRHQHRGMHADGDPLQPRLSLHGRLSARVRRRARGQGLARGGRRKNASGRQGSDRLPGYACALGVRASPEHRRHHRRAAGVPPGAEGADPGSRSRGVEAQRSHGICPAGRHGQGHGGPSRRSREDGARVGSTPWVRRARADVWLGA